MENHPIPQDVTGFQFKLIGNMTVKQFAYLVLGFIFAAILWQLPVNVLIKFPFCAFSALLGLGLAYFPISGRPMDLMIENYIKALFSPTQFIYEKVGGKIYFPNQTPFARTKNIKQYENNLSPFPKDKLKTYLESMDAQPKNKIEQVDTHPPIMIITPKTNAPQPNLTTHVAPALQPVAPIQIAHPAPSQTKQMTPPPQPELINQTIHQPLMQIKTTKFASRGFGKPANTPNIPDSANLVTGITKDARGNALSNILVEVRDKDNNPVRAFKTNEFGRFASATPLTNGNYTIEFEDQKAQNKFEKVTIDVAGQIITPIEAVSIDAREELRKSLFSN